MVGIQRLGIYLYTRTLYPFSIRYTPHTVV